MIVKYSFNRLTVPCGPSAADDQSADQQAEVGRDFTGDGREDRDRHAGNAVQVAALGIVVTAQPPERENKQYRRAKIKCIYHSCRHGLLPEHLQHALGNGEPPNDIDRRDQDRNRG